ncbi:MAG TPA: glycosyltransferase family 10 [Puia sp.]|nr:glycosyltransferase family 10 [Puia sp.]
MLVRIVKDWPYPEGFFDQTPEGNGVWGDITFTEDRITECDYLIVLQRPPYAIKVNCPEGNVWLITQEPPVDYFRFFIKSFKYFDRVYAYYKGIRHPNIQSMQPVLPWHLLKSYAYLSSVTIDQLAHKKDELVWITSNKTGFPGQKARMLFRDYLQASKFNFHLYGRGFTPVQDKFEGLFPFKYSVAVENYSIDHYWTEKLADSFLSWCLPFYWGAANLEDYFPSNSFIRIDVNNPKKALSIIQSAIKNREWEKRLGAIEKARNQILNEYQFFPYVAKMIKEDCLTNLRKPRKNYFIPINPYPWSYKIVNQVKYYLSRVFA